MLSETVGISFVLPLVCDPFYTFFRFIVNLLFCKCYIPWCNTQTDFNSLSSNLLECGLFRHGNQFACEPGMLMISNMKNSLTNFWWLLYNINKWNLIGFQSRELRNMRLQEEYICQLKSMNHSVSETKSDCNNILARGQSSFKSKDNTWKKAL